jgi:hypothetical protein
MKNVMLAVLLATFVAASDAHAVFQGVVKYGVQTTVTLSPAGNSAAATVFLVRKSRLAVLGVLTAPPFGSAQLALPALPKGQRLIISVSLPPPGTTMLEVAQGAIDDHFTLSQDGDVVYDVVPGP